jgi:GntR family transcriptional regulator
MTRVSKTPRARTAENATFDFAALLVRSPQTAHLPLYRHIEVALRSAVRSGELAAGAGIPPERELAALLGVSRVTIRRAIEDLVHQGLLQARQGSGTTVSARVEQSLPTLGSFSEDMTRRGYRPGSRWISREIARPSPEEILALGLGLGDTVLRVARIRTADGAPIAVERASLNAELLGGQREFGDSLYEALRRRGFAPERAFQRVRAEPCGERDAKLLDVEVGDAVLATERRSFTREGRPVELTRAVYRGDRYDYVTELRIEPEGAAAGDGAP